MLLRILFLSALTCGSATIFATLKEFKTLEAYQKAYSSKKPLITMYSGTGHCAPCRAMKPHFIKAAEQYTGIQFCIIDTEDSILEPLFDKNGVQSIPTLIFSINGKEVIKRKNEGLTQTQLEEAIQLFKTELAARKKKRQSLSRQSSDNKKSTQKRIVSKPEARNKRKKRSE